MKAKILSLLIILFFLNFPAAAQDYIFFSDSPNNTYYDYSFGFYNAPSSLVMSNSTKFPVDVNTKYSGVNSLRLRWKSVTGGDWGMAAAAPGWTAFDVTSKDSIVFRLYSAASFDTSALPLIYLEDLQNRKTPKQIISNYVSAIEEDTWIKISIPLSPFISAPGDVDLTKIKTIYFGQNNADGILRTIYLDEVRIISAGDTDVTPPAAPAGLSAAPYHNYINLKWTPNTESDLAGYRIYRTQAEDFRITGTAARNATYYNDNTGAPPKTFSYKITAFDSSGNESEFSLPVTATTISAPDSVLLDSVQAATFRYFWDYAHPVSGLTRERLGSGDIVTTGGSGFGIMAILAGIERKYITREAAVERMLKILDFLSTKADRFHGAFPHWLNGITGNVIPFSQKDNGGDLVETAFMIQGLLTARQYFNGDNENEEQIRNLITSIWESVEWDWYRREPGSKFLYWHWSPNFNWDMDFALQGPNETMITYLLAIASPTHSIPASMYHEGWAGSPNYLNGKSFYGIPLEVGWDYGGPLFFAHYSFMGFDPRNKKDAYTNYFLNNRNHALIHRAYSIDNPKNFPGYDEDTWGLTASDDPFGYLAHEPSNDNGTISPTAALASMPYTPEESIAALKSFYYEYGSSIWGYYGFKDAFNIKEAWYADSYLAIDQGPIIVMIENYRTGLLWNNFMANPEIQPMLDAIGFVYDSTSTGVDDYTPGTPGNFTLKGNYPNPFNPSTVIQFELPAPGNISVIVYDILGRKVKSLVDGRMDAGVHNVNWDGTDNAGRNVTSGVYIYTVSASGKMLSGKMVLQK
jgi:hypothetical protein